MPKHFSAPWNIRDLIMILSGSLGLFILNTLIFKYFSIGKSIVTQNGLLLFIILTFIIQWLIFLLPLMFLTYRKYKFKWEYFGFKKIALWKLIKSVFFGYLLFIAISLIITLIIIYTNLKIPGYQLQQNIFEIFGTNLPSIIIAGIVVVLIAPFIEEIVFRGFLLASISNRIGITLGSIVSALIFSVAHFPWQSFIPIFILGLIMNSLYIRSKSIWPNIVFHIFNNSLAFIFSLLVAKDIISLDNI